ncbi:hypothetical protein FFLO_05389 [Filobasidium floriforme]|uniref:Probable electron transfer flavoprotein subunit alpha n=1 Tax=Filobasidium floriforme TaxID=5210 RepID=A0A8K0JH09_9TREE|nr:hypothetical protein FFLO_05389 [Filobasidium floriforme]
MFLSRRSIRASSSLLSTAARSTRNASSLVYIEHKDGKLNDSVLHAVTAAKQVKGDLNAIIIGTEEEVGKVTEEVKRIDGFSKIYTASSPDYAHGLAEAITPVLTKFLDSSNPTTHLFSAHTAVNKDLFPRLSGSLNVSMIADIISLSHTDGPQEETVFKRPIYAGNAILEIKTTKEKDRVRVVTVRTTAFDKATLGEGNGAEVVQVEAVGSSSPTKHLSEELTISSRPDLSSAPRVVSGGRALKSAEQFNGVMEPLADSLSAAIGASRAAVDAGYADNSLQVGQTGKVVAPELYMAVGISGAIQHLAGMKESKMIVAINKDPDAPIFQVADHGLVADLFTAVPELTEKIKAAKA